MVLEQDAKMRGMCEDTEGQMKLLRDQVSASTRAGSDFEGDASRRSKLPRSVGPVQSSATRLVSPWGFRVL